LTCSSSSISGRSSSLAEYLPEPLGVDPREVFRLEGTCVLTDTLDLARREDESRDMSLWSLGWYVDVVSFCLGEGAVSVMVGTAGTTDTGRLGGGDADLCGVFLLVDRRGVSLGVVDSG
jgi:hypothetical protein